MTTAYCYTIKGFHGAILSLSDGKVAEMPGSTANVYFGGCVCVCVCVYVLTPFFI